MANNDNVEILLSAIDKASDVLNKVKKGVGDLGDKTKEGEAPAKKFGAAFESITGISLGAAGAMTIGVTALKATIQYLGEAEKAAAESAEVDAKLNAVLASTNAVSGETALRLDALASTISQNIDMDDEMVKSSEAVLLTFTHLNADVFPETLQLAGDMAAVIGGDLTGKVDTLGRALNDFSGYTRLTRTVGGFSDEQKRAIEGFKQSNDLIGYQNYLLGILQTKYGGAAKAIADAGDKSDKLKVSQENLKEAIGANVLPAVRAANDAQARYLDYLTSVVEEQTTYKNLLSETGITQGYYTQGQQVLYGYMKDGKVLTKEQVDEIIKLQRGWDALGDSLEAQGAKFKSLNGDMSMTDEQIQAVSESSQTMISLTASFSSEINGFNSTMDGLLAKRKEEIDLLNKDIFYYGEGSNKVKEQKDALADLDGQIQETEKQHDIATHQIVLNYLTQQLAQDGLSESETQFLLQKGVEWGIYSDTAVTEMNKALEEAEHLKNAVNNIPNSKTITVTFGAPNIGDAEKQLNIDLNGNGIIGRATGGTVNSGQPYIVGERGPEMFVPNQSGTIVPNNKLPVVNNYYGDVYPNIDVRSLGDYLLNRMSVQ